MRPNINYCKLEYVVHYKTKRIHPYSIEIIVVGDTIEEAKKYETWQSLEKKMMDKAHNFRSQKLKLDVKKMTILSNMGKTLYDVKFVNKNSLIS
jgi:hypothetical protein